MTEQPKKVVEVVIDFNGFYLQSGPLSDLSDVPLPGHEVWFDDKIWQVERVIRTLEIPWLSKSDQLSKLLIHIYGGVAGQRLLSEMTQFDQAFAEQSSMILAAPKLSKPGGKIFRFVYIKLSREHD
ncbi:MAG TPA: hypothetical protein V6C89_01545 [Drouetiella sp.]|jgi:kynurenine formamidase